MVFTLKKNWFSLDQTIGEDYVQEIKITGWDKDVALTKLGIEEADFNILNGNAQGYALPSEMKVAINPLAVLPHKTVFHELAHCLLHSKEAMLADSATLTKSIVEVEAEATAYLCCATLQLSGLEESRGYIQDWLAGNELPDSSARRIFAAADKILKAGSK